MSHTIIFPHEIKIYGKPLIVMVEAAMEKPLRGDHIAPDGDEVTILSVCEREDERQEGLAEYLPDEVTTILEDAARRHFERLDGAMSLFYFPALINETEKVAS